MLGAKNSVLAVGVVAPRGIGACGVMEAPPLLSVRRVGATNGKMIIVPDTWNAFIDRVNTKVLDGERVAIVWNSSGDEIDELEILLNTKGVDGQSPVVYIGTSAESWRHVAGLHPGPSPPADGTAPETTLAMEGGSTVHNPSGTNERLLDYPTHLWREVDCDRIEALGVTVTRALDVVKATPRGMNTSHPAWIRLVDEVWLWCVLVQGGAYFQTPLRLKIFTLLYQGLMASPHSELRNFAQRAVDQKKFWRQVCDRSRPVASDKMVDAKGNRLQYKIPEDRLTVTRGPYFNPLIEAKLVWLRHARRSRPEKSKESSRGNPGTS